METIRFWLDMDYRGNDLKPTDKILVGNIDSGEAEFINLSDLLRLFTTLDLDEGGDRLYLTQAERDILANLGSGGSGSTIGFASGANFYYPLNENPANYLTPTSELSADRVVGILGLPNIPNLDASKIVQGIFNSARIPSLPASKISTGQFAVARIPSLPITKITGLALEMAQYILTSAKGQPNGVAPLDANTKVPASYIPTLDANKINTGVFDPARIPQLPYVTPEDLAAQSLTISPEQGAGVTVINDAMGLKVTAQPKSPHLNKELHLFIGQSNMVGRNDGEIDIDGLDAPDVRIKEESIGRDYENHYYSLGVGELSTARLPIQNLNAINGSVSMSMSFAKERLLLNDGIEEIAYLNVASGGTGFVNGNWNPNDALYNLAVSRTLNFLFRNPEYTLASIQWHQGESDALNTQASQDYEANLIAMISALRTKLGYEVPFIVGTMVNSWVAGFEDRERVDAVHRNVSEIISLSDVAILDDLTGLTDELHFNAASLREAGKRYAQKLQDVMNRSNYKLPVKTYLINKKNKWETVPNAETQVDDIRGEVLNSTLAIGETGYNTDAIFNGKASTKMMWIRPSELPSGFGNFISGIKNNGSDFSQAHYFGLRGFGQTNNDNDTRINDPEIAIYLFENLNTWSHIALTYEDGNFAFYLNGNLVNTTVLGNNYDIENGIVQLATFGDITASVSNFPNLLMDDIRIYPFALTASQIGDVASQDVINEVNELDSKYDKTGGPISGNVKINSLDGLSLFDKTHIRSNVGSTITDFLMNDSLMMQLKRIGNEGQMLGFQRSVNSTAANAPFYTFDNNAQSGMYLHKITGELGLVCNRFTVFYSTLGGSITLGGNKLNNFVSNAGVTLRGTIENEDIADFVNKDGLRKALLDKDGNLTLAGGLTQGSDTTWQTLTLTNATGSVRYKIKSGRLLVQVNVTPTSESGNLCQLGVLPTAYRPDEDMLVPISVINSVNNEHVTFQVISSTGLVVISSPELNEQHRLSAEFTIDTDD